MSKEQESSMDDDVDPRVQDIVGDAFDKMVALGFSGPDAAHFLISGGLMALRASCCDHHLAEELATVTDGITSLRAEWFN